MIDVERKLKIKLQASLAVLDSDSAAFEKMKAAIKLPEEKDRQPDLTYLTAVLVSSGMNRNGAYFLPSELLQSFGSISNKPLDVEHEELGIVGHMVGAYLFDQDGNLQDIEEIKKKDQAEIEKLKLDIVIAAIIYKDRYPKVAEDAKSGAFCVSMECFYTHYDVIIGDVIIPASSANFISASVDCPKDLELFYENKSYGTVSLGRVLRNILFCGAGLVENPANVRSVILEAAAVEQEDEVVSLNIDMLPLSVIMSSPVIRNLINYNQELAFAAYTGGHGHDFTGGVDGNKTAIGGGHGHIVLKGDLPDHVNLMVWDGGYHEHSLVVDANKTKPEEGSHTHLVDYFKDGEEWLLLETEPASIKHFHELRNEQTTSYGGSHWHFIKLPGDTEVKVKTVFGKKMLKKYLELHSRDYPTAIISQAALQDGTPASKNPGQCVSFKKYVYEIVGTPDSAYDPKTSLPAPPLPGAGDSLPQNVRLKHTHWCSLFNLECSSLGGDATSGKCLRNIINSTTRELISNDRELLMSERVKYLDNLLKKLDNLSDVAKASLNKEEAEKWTREYINTLPNAAFAVVESGYKEGDNKNARHLPHHSKGVKSATENSSVDLSHYRNALARANQIRSVLKKESDATLRKKAAAHLAKHRAVLQKSKGNFNDSDLKLWEECEKLFNENILPLLADDNGG